MTKSRLEAFSDGVIAIIITILVLELKLPHGGDWNSLQPVLPVFLTYILSFIFLGIYWTNHHHMFQMVDHINGKILWANLHLLFWLSLVPFMTAWVGENHFAPLPTAIYGADFLMSGVAWKILQASIISLQGPNSRLAAAIRGDFKGNVSLTLYAIAVSIAFFRPLISAALYVTVAIMWFVPDRRIESRVKNSD
jgi:uncharacterized membrane protein